MSVKLIIMGVGGVGKSAITNRYVRGRWIAKYDPTIEESYQKPCEVDGEVLQVEILDTAGQDSYTSLRQTFMHTGDAFVLVYSVTDDDTLDRLDEIHAQIQKAHPNPNVPIILVGNKVDMENERAVTKVEGETYAKKINASFTEVSAKTNTGVTEAFHSILRKVMHAGASAPAPAATGNVFGGSTDTSGDGYDYSAAKNPSRQRSSRGVGKPEQGKKKGFFAMCNIL